MTKNQMQKCPTPPMGWNSYCTVNCEPTEELILRAADELVATGLKDCGYVYVNLDDGWLYPERDENGKLRERLDRFPHGMKYLTDYIHARGLKAGTYLGCGLKTWNGDAGSLGHEYEDAKTIAEMGFDYLKYDFHPMEEDPPRNMMAEYVKMGKAVDCCGRDIVYNLCEHGEASPWKWAAVCGSLYRVSSDIRDRFDGPGECRGVMQIIDQSAVISAPYTRPGSYGDNDMLVVGMRHQNDWMGNGMTDTEYATNFALWCLTASPLLIGAAPSRIKNDSVAMDILKNPRLIAINQDPLVLPASRVRHEPEGADVWVRPLSGFRWCVAVCNRASVRMDFEFTWKEIGVAGCIPMEITDEWTGNKLANGVKDKFTVSCDSHETKVLTLYPEL